MSYYAYFDTQRALLQTDFYSSAQTEKIAVFKTSWQDGNNHYQHTFRSRDNGSSDSVAFELPALEVHLPSLQQVTKIFLHLCCRSLLRLVVVEDGRRILRASVLRIESKVSQLI